MINMVKEYVPGEGKKEKFNRIATIRTKRVLEKLRVLGNCANRGTYEYTENDVKKIFFAIEDEIKRVKSLFKKPVDKEFKL